MSGATQEQMYMPRSPYEPSSPQSPSPVSRIRSPSGLGESQQLRLPMFQGSPPSSARGGSPLTLQPPPPPMAPFDPIRLQQLYTLALADKMRLFHQQHQASPAPSLFPPYPAGHPFALASQSARLPIPPPLPHPGSHPVDFAYAYGKFDPRFFRVPDEPKPQHSYIGLIAMAILSCKEQKLVLADIYQYILDNFSYFRHRGPGWRNSIRHNLSLNDCFVKAGRAANGKGHFWAIHPACIEDFKRGDFRRRKAQRKVRRHMGLAVDEEDSPSPPPTPSLSPGMSQAMGLPLHWLGATAAGLRPPHPPPHFLHHLHRAPGFPPQLSSLTSSNNPHHHHHHNNNTISSSGSGNGNGNSHQTTITTPATAKRLFDVDSLLSEKDEISVGQEMAKRLKREVEERIFKNRMDNKIDTDNNSLSGNDDDTDTDAQHHLDVVSLDGDDDLEAANDDEDNKHDQKAKSSLSLSPPPPPPPAQFLGQAWAARAAAAAVAEKNSPPLSAGESGFPPLPPSAQEYFARYYQMLHQQHQEKAVAALNAAAEASAKISSPVLLHRRFEATIEQQTN